MKRQTINFSWPATLSFSADNSNENERFSRGKLKVFYRGETADHRYFSDDFSQEVIKSLPYTPIVSYYDEEKDDFVGHATEQAIYGIVDPCGEVSFETDDEGKSWCICDTVMYTERPDKVGEIAKKIEGHSQSLELDPNTVKYTVNYDEKRHFKNIEFTAGHFVGVSVLGSKQKPAFTGSEFFSADVNFEEKMKLLKEYCEQKNAQTQSGGNEMNLQEFITLSWGDKSQKVAEAITKEYENEYFAYIVDMFDDCAVCRFYSYIDGSNKLLRVNYSCDDNGVITLGDVNEVHVVYEDVPAPVNTDATLEDLGVVGNESTTVVNAECSGNDSSSDGKKPEDDKQEDENKNDKIEDAACGDEDKKDVEDAACGDKEKEKESKCAIDNDAATSSDEVTAEDAAQLTDAQDTNTEKVGAVDEQNQEEDTSSATFTDSERAEFETLKREKKENLINSYKEYLTEEENNSFFAAIDTTTYEQLEIELLKIYKRKSEEPAKVERAFSLSSYLNIKKDDENTLGAIIKRYL